MRISRHEYNFSPPLLLLKHSLILCFPLKKKYFFFCSCINLIIMVLSSVVHGGCPSNFWRTRDVQKSVSASISAGQSRHKLALKVLWPGLTRTWLALMRIKKSWTKKNIGHGHGQSRPVPSMSLSASHDNTSPKCRDKKNVFNYREFFFYF